MIAQRFRALGWVAGIASASTALYLISVQVAAERARLEEVDRRISETHRDMLQLKTELSTRASYRQLEKWNDEDLDLAAPRAAQYLHSESQLASLSPDMLDAVADKPVPRAQLAAAQTAPPPVVPTLPQATSPIRNAAYVPMAASSSSTRVAKPEKIALVARDRLGGLGGDLVKAAAKESRKRP